MRPKTEDGFLAAPFRATKRSRGAGRAPHRMTLRVKAVLALLALGVYVATMTALFVVQKDSFAREFDALAGVYRLQENLVSLELALARAVADVHAAADRASPGTADGRLLRQIATALGQATAYAQRFPETAAGLATGIARLAGASEAYRADPSREALTGLARTLEGVLATLAAVDVRLDLRADDRAAAVRAQGQTIAVTTFVVGLLGMALIAAFVVLFFTRMAADLELLRLRAADIVTGRRRHPIPLERSDEVGELAMAIDHIGEALSARERDLELERQKGFHQEKMIAVGALAAGVLTEIGNPIAAIDGFARALRDQRCDEPAPELEAILEQTARLAAISHEISAVAAPPSSRHELLDLNAVVENALRLLRFDPRFAPLDIGTDLDRQLPALPGRGDRLVQLVMNLVGNAADAVGDTRSAAPRIRIATSLAEAHVALEVADDGPGMSDEVRRRAFEPFFSTKPAGRGTGLGLPLCRSIADEHGGTLRLDSAPGRGTRITLLLPLAEQREKARFHSHDVAAGSRRRR